MNAKIIFAGLLLAAAPAVAPRHASVARAEDPVREKPASPIVTGRAQFLVELRAAHAAVVKSGDDLRNAYGTRTAARRTIAALDGGPTEPANLHAAAITLADVWNEAYLARIAVLDDVSDLLAREIERVDSGVSTPAEIAALRLDFGHWESRAAALHAAFDGEARAIAGRMRAQEDFRKGKLNEDQLRARLAELEHPFFGKEGFTTLAGLRFFAPISLALEGRFIHDPAQDREPFEGTVLEAAWQAHERDRRTLARLVARHAELVEAIRFCARHLDPRAPVMAEKVPATLVADYRLPNEILPESQDATIPAQLRLAGWGLLEELAAVDARAKHAAEALAMSRAWLWDAAAKDGKLDATGRAAELAKAAADVLGPAPAKVEERDMLGLLPDDLSARLAERASRTAAEAVRAQRSLWRWLGEEERSQELSLVVDAAAPFLPLRDLMDGRARGANTDGVTAAALVDAYAEAFAAEKPEVESVEAMKKLKDAGGRSFWDRATLKRELENPADPLTEMELEEVIRVLQVKGALESMGKKVE